ncbi:MAG: endonuclease/exonuclease/phosphatase family protein [Phycisphaerales bacterium]|nr:endonuclease/exonuclease/phosphatase family protein [Phycisphaerales bacterium]
MKRAGAASLAALIAAPALAQLRIATWNVTAYNGPGPRDAAFGTALYAQFQGRSLAPDALVGQEFTSAAAVTAFLNILNTAPGSPGDWAAAPFVPGPDTGNAFFFRTSRASFDGVTTISYGGQAPEPPRNTERYDVRPHGYGAGAQLAIYSLHMKAGSASADAARRLTEAGRIRADAATLTTPFIIAGDFNIQSSSEAGYQALIGPLPGGRAFDPIATPGHWNNNPAFRFVHTQAPGGVATQTGGMDDRFDQLLLSVGLIDGAGMDYRGVALRPYSTAAWNDPDHSYRVWGNDGASFNTELVVTTNQMAGPFIAQALRDSTAADIFGGHLPVFLDLRVPAKVGAPPALDFGTVPMGGGVGRDLTVRNDGDAALWGPAGVADLRYTLEATIGFTAPPGMFTATTGAGNIHTITMGAAPAGPVSGVLTIHSDDPDSPAWTVALSGFVCYPDCNADGVLNLADFGCFQTRFALAAPYADCNGDGVRNLSDFGCFTTSFAMGCP